MTVPPKLRLALNNLKVVCKKLHELEREMAAQPVQRMTPAQRTRLLTDLRYRVTLGGWCGAVARQLRHDWQRWEHTDDAPTAKHIAERLQWCIDTLEADPALTEARTAGVVVRLVDESLATIDYLLHEEVRIP